MRTLLLLLCTALLGACSCQPQPAVDSATAPPRATPGATAAVSDDGAIAPASAVAARSDARRAQAIRDAVDSLHGYLRELGSGQLDEAEKRWAYQRSPSVNEEAGLRSLDGMKTLRIDNGIPKPLDTEAVPAYLEIPVQLRASMEGGETRRFHGWYRLRHDPVTMRWELTAASVSPVIR